MPEQNFAIKIFHDSLQSKNIIVAILNFFIKMNSKALKNSFICIKSHKLAKISSSSENPPFPLTSAWIIKPFKDIS